MVKGTASAIPGPVHEGAVKQMVKGTASAIRGPVHEGT